MTYAEWDISGRYILTSSFSTKGIQIWNAYGD